MVFTYIHTYIHTYIQTDRQTDRQAGRQTGRQVDRYYDDIVIMDIYIYNIYNILYIYIIPDMGINSSIYYNHQVKDSSDDCNT